jgi:TPR repeat protein
MDDYFPQSSDLDADTIELSADMRGILANAADVQRFALAGNATITLVSAKTGTRFTYKVRKPQNQEQPGPVRHFVSVLTGSDNENAYTYLGQMYNRPSGAMYSHGRKSRIGLDSTSAKAFDWFWRAIAKGRMPDNVQVWHEGRCGRCGRKLTVPQSIADGFGPECAGRL